MRDKKVNKRQWAALFLVLQVSSSLDILTAMSTPTNTPSTSPLATDRTGLLAQLASITTMQRGTLGEEHRERPAPEGKGMVRRGPYFKHQCWEGGRNRSRRVPADEVPLLREDLANAQRFDALTEQLAELNITHTRVLRTAQQDETKLDGLAAGKKNSRPNALPKGMAKPKASSPKRARASPKRA